MKSVSRILLTALLVVVCLVSVISGQDPEVVPETESAKMIRILRGMSDFLTGPKSFGFTVHELVDEVDGGMRVQYSSTRSIVVRRPNRLASEAQGDLVNQAFWYDGKSFTLLDRERNSYIQSKAPGTIDALLDDVEDRFQVVLPMGELLSEDIYKNLTQKIQVATYVGLHQVRGIPCHHLVFAQESLDWQLWVEASRTPVPRKIVISYKQEPGVPQYTAVISTWDLTMNTPDEVFRFTPPEGARKIDLPAAKEVIEK